jgi:hypothetical protein
LLATLALLLLYLQANNRKITPQNSKMQPNKYPISLIKSTVKTYNKQVTLTDWHTKGSLKNIQQTSHSIRLAYARQVSYFKCDTSQGNKRGENTGKFVVIQHQLLQFPQLAQFSGDGTWVYKTQSKHTQNKPPYPTGTKGHKESEPAY